MGSTIVERPRRSVVVVATAALFFATGCRAHAAALPAPSEVDAPHVHLLATGGTISGGQQPLDAAGLKALVPGLAQVATVTIEDIARTIIRMTESSSKIVYRPLPEDDPKVRQPDITRARTILGWEPKVGLEDGLSRTLEYFRKKV